MPLLLTQNDLELLIEGIVVMLAMGFLIGVVLGAGKRR